MSIIDDMRGLIKKPRRIVIDSKETLEEAAVYFGLLPFFTNPVKGLSVQEMCAPGMLFGGNIDEGCWEWKGPVIRRRTTAYGKFFRRKAGFVSLDLFPHFLNYRRRAYPVSPDSTEEILLEIIRENDGMTSTELKNHIFGPRSFKREWDDLPDLDGSVKRSGKRKSLEGPLQRLQMGGWLLISDFEYKRTKSGERYGWGVARYSTPELIFNTRFDNSPGEATDSLHYLIRELKKRWPGLSTKTAVALLK